MTKFIGFVRHILRKFASCFGWKQLFVNCNVSPWFVVLPTVSNEYHTLDTKANLSEGSRWERVCLKSNLKTFIIVGLGLACLLLDLSSSS